MALNPEKIKFLVQRIQNSEYRTFQSIVTQLFTYLSQEIKDNPIYDKFEMDSEKWSKWFGPGKAGDGRGRLDFPNNLEDAKSLSYNLYKNIAVKEKS